MKVTISFDTYSNGYDKTARTMEVELAPKLSRREYREIMKDIEEKEYRVQMRCIVGHAYASDPRRYLRTATAVKGVSLDCQVKGVHADTPLKLAILCGNLDFASVYIEVRKGEFSCDELISVFGMGYNLEMLINTLHDFGGATTTDLVYCSAMANNKRAVEHVFSIGDAHDLSYEEACDVMETASFEVFLVLLQHDMFDFGDYGEDMLVHAEEIGRGDLEDYIIEGMEQADEEDEEASEEDDDE